jgi:hypothetical protein
MNRVYMRAPHYHSPPSPHSLFYDIEGEIEGTFKGTVMVLRTQAVSGSKPDILNFIDHFRPLFLFH